MFKKKIIKLVGERSGKNYVCGGGKPSGGQAEYWPKFVQLLYKHITIAI